MKLGWNLVHMSVEMTSTILMVVTSALLLIGVHMQWKNARNFYSLFLNTAAVSGVYVSIMYFPFRRNEITGILIGSLLIWCTYACFVILKKRMIKLQKMRQILLGAYLIFAMASFFIVTLEEVDDFQDKILLVSTNDVITEDNREYQTIESHKDILMNLDEEIWRNMTPQARLNLLQIIANIEQKSLGIVTNARVSTANLSRFYYGFYRDQTEEIVVTADLLMAESPKEVISTLCHEVYHTYQYKLVDFYEALDEGGRQLRLFDRAERYGYEFEHYNSGREDMEAYRRQACETDARAYAENAVMQYMSMMHFYKLEEERGEK